MEKKLYDEARRLQDKISDLKQRQNDLHRATIQGGCGWKARVAYTPGGSFDSTTVDIADTEVIRQALTCELDCVERELALLEEQFENL